MAPAASQPRTGTATTGTALAAAWLAAVAVVAVLRDDVGAVSAASLACSPERLAHGAVWTLLSSAFVIDGPPVGQLVMTAMLTVWVIEALGARGFWLVAAAGHVGATLVTYAGIGVLWLVVGTRMEEVTDAPDFGISAVWAALMGALAVATWRLGPSRRRRVAAAAGLTVLGAFALLVPLDGELSDVEHLLAFVAGALTALWLSRDLNAPLIGRQSTVRRVTAEGVPPQPTHPSPHPPRAA